MVFVLPVPGGPWRVYGMTRLWNTIDLTASCKQDRQERRLVRCGPGSPPSARNSDYCPSITSCLAAEACRQDLIAVLDDLPDLETASYGQVVFRSSGWTLLEDDTRHL